MDYIGRVKMATTTAKMKKICFHCPFSASDINEFIPHYIANHYGTEWTVVTFEFLVGIYNYRFFVRIINFIFKKAND